MNQNKVNPWMISTVVLALVGGFLIGCDSPRQQLGAQTSSGVTASELDQVLRKYFRSPEDAVFVIHPGNSPNGSEIFSTLNRRFWITRFHMTSGSSASTCVEVNLNGQYAWNVCPEGTVTTSPWISFDGFLLQPGDVITKAVGNAPWCSADTTLTDRPA
ncbi:MAG TPA: hypothetical protein EYQ84_05530 [Nitrospinaceae bacterium]|nr:hypothetical protein [Nitrospinaceae bacterium]